MKRYACIAAVCATLLTGALRADAFETLAPPVAAQGTWQAAFSPWDDIESLLTQAIDAARKQVLVQAYLLTNKQIIAALIAAHQRGLDVRVLVDAEQLGKPNSSEVSKLVDAGVAVWLETKYRNAHNKIIVIDAATAKPTVITGSFNFTWAAQHRNAENVLISRNDPTLAARYALNWERHRQDASPYEK